MSRRPAGDLTVSPAAAALIDLVPALSFSTLHAIERGLLAELALPSGAELREARLGLLLFMLRDGSGMVPRTEDYDQLRAEREALGESWPHSTTIIRAYSHSWRVAVRAAMRLLHDGPEARVAHRHTGRGLADDFERDEVLQALVRFRDEHDGRWPLSTQFFDWGEYERRAALAAGRPVPRVPSRSAFRRHFKRFELGLAAARLRSEQQ